MGGWGIDSRGSAEGWGGVGGGGEGGLGGFVCVCGFDGDGLRGRAHSSSVT